MRVLAVLLVILALQSKYTGPKNGEKRDNNFSFSHTSDWQQRQVTNVIQNDHTRSLIVDWPVGGITRGERNPLPSRSSDLNRYGCPEDMLAPRDTAELYYGLGRTPKIAGAYACGQVAQVSPELQSEVILSTLEGQYTIKVVSTVSDGRAINTFSMNRDALIALSVPETLVKDFAAQDWKPTPRALTAITGAEMLTTRPLISGADSYYLLAPPFRESVIRFSAPTFARTTSLLLVVTPNRTYVGSGFVSLYVPRP